jgi:hypothetical protein
VAPGAHEVTVTGDTGTVQRSVTVPTTGTASVMFALPKSAGPVGGWVTIAAPFEVDLVEHGDVIGTSGSSRIMLPSGRHDLVLVNAELGYREARRVDVGAGKTTTVGIDAPKASLNINARPWAEVTIDRNAVGETPIANLSVTIGRHDVVFRHPQYGERKLVVLVTAKGPNRLTADLTR